jgi:DNA helicase MCM9
LEPGALVLADGGICCVDEFNCMKEADKTSMLEAMEQQTISVAKAGIVCKLKTQCSVLAACNPKGFYDSNQPVTVNINMSTPLLSRFDVILLLLDTPNEEWDQKASTFLLQGKDILKKSNKCDLWDFDKLKLYLNYVKRFEPVLCEKAHSIIQTYYKLQRDSDDRSASRTTVRMLESIVRLCQAHAKLMHRETVEVMDVVVAITLIECSSNRTEAFDSVNILHISFPPDAELEYTKQFQVVLGRLKKNYPDLKGVIEEELERTQFFEKKDLSHPQMSKSSSELMSQFKETPPRKKSTQNRVFPQQSQNSNQPAPPSTQSNKLETLRNNKRFLDEITNESISYSPNRKILKTQDSNSTSQSQFNNKSVMTQSVLDINGSQAAKANQTLSALSEINEDDLNIDSD